MRVEDMFDLAVCVHATGPYLAYAAELGSMIAAQWAPDRRIEMLIFTDEPERVRGWPTTNGIEFRGIEVPHRSWPAATLLRFGDYARHGEEISAPWVVFLDADMAVVGPLGDDFGSDTWVNAIAFVLHPGFFRQTDHGRPSGSWETRPESLAFVPETNRRAYICGGSWMGARSAVLGVCAELAVRIELDSRAGVTAVWHDESHLNWWQAQYGATLLEPEYCFVPSYPQLVGLTPRVVALDKPDSLVRAIKG